MQLNEGTYVHFDEHNKGWEVKLNASISILVDPQTVKIEAGGDKLENEKSIFQTNEVSNILYKAIYSVHDYFNWLYIISPTEIAKRGQIKAFDYLMVADSLVTFDINQTTKDIDIKIDDLSISDFKITQDYGTGIIEQEAEIKESYDQMMGLMKVVINKYLPTLGLRLP